jgi:ankyrin repeat protein
MTNDANHQLIAAAEQGSASAILAAIGAGADVNYQQSLGFTALMIVAGSAPVAATEALLSRGANVNIKNRVGATALMTAAIDGRSDVVRALLSAGADIEAATSTGDTVLMGACYGGHGEVVDMLLQAGAKVNRRTVRGGSTALIYATTGGHAAIVRRLLESGADVSLRDFGGRDAYQVAIESRHTEVADLLKQSAASRATTSPATSGANTESGPRSGKELLAVAEEILLRTSDTETQLREAFRRALACEVVQGILEEFSSTLARELVTRLGKEKASQIDFDRVVARTTQEVRRYMGRLSSPLPRGLNQVAIDVAREFSRPWWKFWG